MSEPGLDKGADALRRGLCRCAPGALPVGSYHLSGLILAGDGVGKPPSVLAAKGGRADGNCRR